MHLLEIFCDLKDRSKAGEFAEDVQAFLSYLHEREFIEGYRILRQNFGITPPAMGEYHIMIECRSTEQLDRAFEFVASADEGIAALKKPVQEAVKTMKVSLYSDYPEAVKKR
jgi:hypothetical protein